MADDNVPTLAETVNAAIAEVTTAPIVENADGDSTATDESTADSGAGDPAGTGSTDAGSGVDTGGTEDADLADGDRAADASAETEETDEVDENDPEAVKAAEAAGRTRDPKTGKFAKAEKKVETAEEKAARETAAKAKPAVKAPDALNDPIPKDVKKQTADRIRTLIDTAKKSDEKATAVEADRNVLLDRIITSTASPEQYQQTLEIIRQMNSNDPAEQRKALDAIQATATELATRLGVVLPGVDALAKYPDLKQKVELGQLSRHDAEEIAGARSREAHTTQTREQQQTAQREQAAFNTAKTTAKAGLTALGETLRTADPNYEAKAGILVEALKPVFAKLHPSEWVGAFQAAYNKMPTPVAASRPAPRIVPQNQPLRARQATGGKATEPKSMLDAVNSALASMG